MINPNEKFPLPNIDRLCFLKNIIKNTNILKWWDLPIEKITEHAKDIAIGNLEIFS